MKRGQAVRVTGRALAAIGIAVLVSIGIAGGVQAKPADRGDDAVVLRGGQLTGLLGASPGQIVGFAYRRGRWVQMPVQVDERHTINVRQLYPPGTWTHIGDDSPAFDLEVYADPKTRSGADINPAFDPDDELAFMAGDTGGRAPKGVGAPSGVKRSTGVRVAVKDPVRGGTAWLYLFRSILARNPAGKRVPQLDLDPSARRDYVKYDFKLTGLTAGQTLLNDYGYVTSSNPEDSSVSTRSYRLHSVDRWMEDELRVKAGKASRADILDREVAQATRWQCGRSEYTFSGRWTEDNWAGNDGDTDDEGTYVATIDGPVRAIRSYMGANSGPYTQREHIYYRDYEQNTIFLRVHPMLDLYAWTDFSEQAIGMTYRDSKNQRGVPVDGVQDSLSPTTTADVADGAWAWQQLTGRQGTVTSVIGADTDIPKAKFGNYYLDAENPPVGQIQCGGDGRSIGASGFGILGTDDGPQTPNTDPRHPPFNDLTVKRVRYFDGPGAGAAMAGRYADRIARPLAATASSSPMKKPSAGGKVRLVNRGVKARPGRILRLKLKVTNTGNFDLRGVKLCVGHRPATGITCRRIGRIALGRSKTVRMSVRVKRNARGKRLSLVATLTGQAGDWGVSGGGSGPTVPLIRR